MGLGQGPNRLQLITLLQIVWFESIHMTDTRYRLGGNQFAAKSSIESNPVAE